MKSATAPAMTAADARLSSPSSSSSSSGARVGAPVARANFFFRFGERARAGRVGAGDANAEAAVGARDGAAATEQSTDRDHAAPAKNQPSSTSAQASTKTASTKLPAAQDAFEKADTFARPAAPSHDTARPPRKPSRENGVHALSAASYGFGSPLRARGRTRHGGEEGWPGGRGATRLMRESPQLIEVDSQPTSL